MAPPRLEGLADADEPGLRIAPRAACCTTSSGGRTRRSRRFEASSSTPDGRQRLAERLEAASPTDAPTVETRLDRAGFALRPRLEAANRAARVPGVAGGGASASPRDDGSAICVASAASGCTRSATSAPRSTNTSRLVALAPRGSPRSRIACASWPISARDPARSASGLVAGERAEPRRRPQGRARSCGPPASRIAGWGARPRQPRCSRRASAEPAASLEEPPRGPAAPRGAPRRARRTARSALDVLERLAAAEPEGRREATGLGPRRAARGRAGRHRSGASAAWQARLDPRSCATPRRWRPRARCSSGHARWPDLIASSCDVASPARHPPHQIHADLVEIATLARVRVRDLPLRHRHLARDRDPLRRGRRQRRDALADLLEESGAFGELRRVPGPAGRASIGARARRSARASGRGPRGPKGRRPPARSSGMGGRSTSSPRTRPRAPELSCAAFLGDERLGPEAANARSARAPRGADGLVAAAARPRSPTSLAGLTDASGPRPVARGGRRPGRGEARGDRERGVRWSCAALPLAGAALALEREVLRLAEATGGFARAAEALAEIAAGGLTRVPPRPPARAPGGPARRADGRSPARRADSFAVGRRAHARAASRTRRQPRARHRCTSATSPALPRLDTSTRGSRPQCARRSCCRSTRLLAREAGQLPAAVAELARGGGSRRRSRSPRSAARAARAGRGRLARRMPGRGRSRRRPRPCAGRRSRTTSRRCDAAPSCSARVRTPASSRRALERLALEQPNDLDFLREAAGRRAQAAADDERLALDLLGRLVDQAMRLARLGTLAAGTHTAVAAATWAARRAGSPCTSPRARRSACASRRRC